MFSAFFIKRPRFSFVISILTVLVGIIAIFSLPIALYPDVTPPQITVSATYPGASADVIARTVGIPIEDEINGIEDMLYMDSSSEDSTYTLTVTFEIGTDPDTAQVKVQNRVQQANSKLPDEVTRQGLEVERKSSSTLAFIVFSSKSGKTDEKQIADYVYNNIERALSRLPGVGSVDVYSSQLGIRIWLNADKMAATQITASEINQAVSSQNYQPALGKVGTAPTDSNTPMVYTLQTNGRMSTVEEFENIIVRTAGDGSVVRLKDVARVELGQESYAMSSLYNGSSAVSLSISLSTGANALQTMQAVEDTLAELSKSFPEDLEYRISYDSTAYIHASIEEVVFTLILTLMLVVGVCYFFLQDFYSTLIPTLTIPVSILGTFAVISLLGYSINMFTLFAMLLAIGAVVDDAIVVVERVVYLMQNENMKAKDATLKAMGEITGALVATSCVLLAIFVPVGFMSGIVGKIYQQFSVTISVAIMFSLINALTLSPALCSLLIKKIKPRTEGFWFKVNSFISRVIHLYSVVVSFIAKNLAAVFAIFATLCVLVGVLFATAQSSFIPDEDQGLIVMSMQLPEGASQKRTEALIKRANKIIMDEPSVDNATNVVGYSMLGGRGENIAMAFIVLKPWEERKSIAEYSTNILRRLQAKMSQFPEAQFQFFEMPAISGIGTANGLDIRFQSRQSMDYQKLDAALQGFLAHLNQLPDISYAYSTFNAKTPNIFLDINREKAESMKVSMSNIFTTLETFLGSAYINDINLGTQVNKVMMQSDWMYRDNIDNINELHVMNNDGDMVPMRGLVNLRKVLAPRSVERYNQYPAATITAVQADGSSTGKAMDAVEGLKDVLPKGFNIEWSTMSYQEKTSSGQIGAVLLLSLVFAYLFLVAQYESFVVPIPVILSLVMAISGALIGLFFAGLPLSIYAQLGIILLIGMASKNAILIVEFARDERAKGATIVSAAIRGLKERFRAVLMTASAFVLGVWPMVIASGAAAASRRSLGIPVFWGMLIGTLGGLMLIPMIYVLIQTLSEKFFAVIHKFKKSEE